MTQNKFQQFFRAAASWIRDKEMKVLQFASAAHRETPVDVFVIEPFDFQLEYQRALSDSVDVLGQESVIARYMAIASAHRDEGSCRPAARPR